MRFRTQALIATVSAVALASCTDAFSTGPGKSRASLTIVPRFSQSASLASATLAEAGVTYDAVRIVIVRPVSDTLKDTTIAFSPTSPEITLELSIAATPGDSVDAELQFRQGNSIIFRGTRKIRTVAPVSASAPAPIEVTVTYTGPGADADTVVIDPGPGIYSASSNTQFTAKAFDGTTELASTPIFWSVSDESKATISAAGVLTPKGQRATIAVTATAANGVKSTIPVQLAAAAAGLQIIQGALAHGPAGTELGLEAVVQLVASDGLPAAGTGQTVTFSAPSGFGSSITPTTAVLDAHGQAKAKMTVGTKTGSTYKFVAAVGAFSVDWSAVADPGTPTHFVAENGTTFTIKAGVIPTGDQMPRIRVADADDNSVPGTFVKLTVSRNGTQIAQGTVPADEIGKLEVYRTALTLAGSYTIVVESVGIALPSITYDITITPDVAAKLAFAVQPSTVAQNAVMTPAVKVEVQDQYGNLVAGATGTISISLDAASVTAGVSQSGTGSMSLSGGVATFTNLKFSGTRSGVKIQAIGASLPGVFSNTFDITP